MGQRLIAASEGQAAGQMTVAGSGASEQPRAVTRWEKIEPYVLWVAVAILIYVIYANYQEHGLTLLDWDWLFISGFSAFIAVVQVARSLDPKFDTLLNRLSDRGVLVSTAQPPVFLSRDAQPIKLLRRTMGNLEDWMTQIVGIIVGLILLLACVAAFGQFGMQVLLQHLGFTIVATAAGYVAGHHIGQMIAYSFLARLMATVNVEIQVKAGHIDGAAGLKPIGSFYFFQAMLLVIPALFLGIWWFLFHTDVWQARYADQWLDSYLAMLLIVVAFEIAAFVLPMWRFHTIMQDQKGNRIRDADELSVKIENLQAEQDTVDGEQSAARLKEQLAAMQREYWDIENMPTWPVDLPTWRRFARNNVVLMLPLLTKLVGAESLAGRILGTLDAVLKKPTG